MTVLGDQSSSGHLELLWQTVSTTPCRFEVLAYLPWALMPVVVPNARSTGITCGSSQSA